jgi:hypothetical protein
MANLDQIQALHEKYKKKDSPFLGLIDHDLITEAFDPDKIEKAFDDPLGKLGPTYAGHFDLELPVNAALLYVDVFNSTGKFGDFSGIEIADYFHKYYDIVIPKIYQFNGEIDKIMGDGIVAIFAPPFNENTFEQNITNACLAAKAILGETDSPELTSKVALHAGKVHYFKNRSGYYNEYTMIGKPLTELFRLEGLGKEQQIVYYHGSEVGKHFMESIAKREARKKRGIVKASDPFWKHDSQIETEVAGLGGRTLRFAKYQTQK